MMLLRRLMFCAAVAITNAACVSQAPRSAQSLTDPQQNIAVATRIFTEKMAQGRMDRLHEIYAADFVAHVGGQSFSLDQGNAAIADMRKAFPDLSVSVRQALAHGEYVTIWWSLKGTNSAASAGFPTVTGKTAALDALSLFRFRDGRVAEEWNAYDFNAFLDQLGLRRSPAAEGN